MPTHDQTLTAIREHLEAYFHEVHKDFAFDAASPVVRLHEPTFGPDEIIAALDCLLTTHVTQGPKVKAFENEYAAAYGHMYGVMNNSGSSANLLAVAAVANKEFKDGLKPGDEVIVSALSWSTTVWPLVQMNLVPVIVDIDPRTLNIDPAAVEAAIGPKTRAIMPVHVYGNPCDMDALGDICKRRELILIEDCCEALGAAYDGKPVGRFGLVGTFSFYYSHHMTTLEGGICVTNDHELAEMMRILRAHGWIREVDDRERWTKAHPEINPRFLFVNLGYNLRATELQGAMGSVQLPKLESFVERRRANAAWFRDRLSPYEDIFEFQQETPKGKHSWFGLPMKVRDTAPFTVNELMASLGEANIETRPIICGNIARQPAMKLYEHRTSGTLTEADRVMASGFSFGNHQAIDEAARDYVAGKIDAFIAGQGRG